MSMRQITQSCSSICSRLSSDTEKCSATRGDWVQSSSRVGRPWCWPMIICRYTDWAMLGSSITAYLAKFFRMAGSRLAWS